MTSDCRWFGDRAVLFEVADVASAHALAAAFSARTVRDHDVEDVVVGFRSVLVHLGPDVATHEEVHRHLLTAASKEETGRLAGAPSAPSGQTRPPLEIPVRFDGPDLDDAASAVGGTTGAVAELLTAAELQVAFLGFAPGFPYLVGLPPELAALPRRETPRTSVPAGSVAVAGGFASVYPRSTPGGWMLLGRTTTRLFDPHRRPYARVGPGDRVRFRADPTLEVPSSGPEGAPAPGPSGPGGGGDRFADVLRPGLVSTVQDAGRIGMAGIGVPRAGPADPESMALANRLVGNPADAAAIEVTAFGPALRFSSAAHLAVVGVASDAADLDVDGHPCRPGTVVPVEVGQVVTVGRIGVGLRAYLAVGGGFTTALAVGSRASDVLSGLGAGPLRAGDRLPLGPATRPRGRLTALARRGDGRSRVIRVLAGPHEFPDAAWNRLIDGRWTVTDGSNRVGVRLSGSEGPLRGAVRAIDSVPMVTGAIQVPPGGNPIVLLPDHATIGGYPAIACVIGADLPLVGQLAPGDTVVFVPVDLAEARRLWTRRQSELTSAVSGWFPTAAAT
ncbi:MAG: 5-oxoprolinase/urea amidolyase family protein [Acidimicrobiales bacterium]